MSWQPHRLTPVQMLHESIRRTLTESHPDPGLNAGEHYMTLASERGLEVSDSVNLYRCAVNHAAIADFFDCLFDRAEGVCWCAGH